MVSLHVMTDDEDMSLLSGKTACDDGSGGDLIVIRPTIRQRVRCLHFSNVGIRQQFGCIFSCGHATL